MNKKMIELKKALARIAFNFSEVTIEGVTIVYDKLEVDSDIFTYDEEGNKVAFAGEVTIEDKKVVAVAGKITELTDVVAEKEVEVELEEVEVEPSAIEVKLTELETRIVAIEKQLIVVAETTETISEAVLEFSQESIGTKLINKKVDIAKPIKESNPALKYFTNK